jgi:hypothetical protein
MFSLSYRFPANNILRRKLEIISRPKDSTSAPEAISGEKYRHQYDIKYLEFHSKFIGAKWKMNLYIKVGKASPVNGISVTSQDGLSEKENYTTGFGTGHISSKESIKVGSIYNHELNITVIVSDGNLEVLKRCKNVSEVKELFWGWLIGNITAEQFQELLKRSYEKGKEDGAEEVRVGLRELIGL